MLRIPDAPMSLRKGYPLKNVLGADAVKCLAHNIAHVYPDFKINEFQKCAQDALDTLEFMDRGLHIARTLRRFLPDNYEKAIEILLASLTPANNATEGLGLAVLFYLPHSCFVAEYGLDWTGNGGKDPFEISMRAQYELTKRNTSEFSLRPFLIKEQKRTLSVLKDWTTDPDPHVRRLCSEGIRPRLPWAPRIPAFIKNPKPIFPILEKLKNDKILYVRRSVANNLGDIVKDHPESVYQLVEKWLEQPSNEINWIVRHALRYPAKKGDQIAIRLRSLAKS